MQGLFPLGQIIATPGALETLARASQRPDEFLLRHASGDWELEAPDLAGNMNNLKHGFRVMNTYRPKSGDTVWLITEADRASTTLILPGEYRTFISGVVQVDSQAVDLDARALA